MGSIVIIGARGWAEMAIESLVIGQVMYDRDWMPFDSIIDSQQNMS